MSDGLKTTCRVLAKTNNEAATSALIHALDSPETAITEGALAALLDRRSPTGQREIVSRLHVSGDAWRAVLEDRSEKLSHGLRDAVLSGDVQLCRNGCQAILWFCDYDQFPTLINAAEDESNESRDLCAQTVIDLAEMLCEELSRTRDYRNRRDPNLVRQHVTHALENSSQRYSNHKRTEILESFLILCGRENVFLKRILADPFHPCYLPLVEVLVNSQRHGIMRLVLSYLDDPKAPTAAIGAMARRKDDGFLRLFLRKIGFEPSPVCAKNLKKIDSVSWLQEDLDYLLTLDEAEQHAAVQLGCHCGMNRLEVLRILRFLLAKGGAMGRRAAAEALVNFSGSAANQLALSALEDEDPIVQATIIRQLRGRGIAGVMPRIIEMAESPHHAVQVAVRETLDELSFARFLGTYDTLEDDVRRSTAALVRRINPECWKELLVELKAKGRSRRLRAITMAQEMEVTDHVEEELIVLLEDDDHMIRCEAAESLGACNGKQVIEVLRQRLLDRSVSVQEAAEASILRIMERNRHQQPSTNPLQLPDSMKEVQA